MQNYFFAKGLLEFFFKLEFVLPIKVQYLIAPVSMHKNLFPSSSTTTFSFIDELSENTLIFLLKTSSVLSL